MPNNCLGGGGVMEMVLDTEVILNLSFSLVLSMV